MPDDPMIEEECPGDLERIIAYVKGDHGCPFSLNGSSALLLVGEIDRLRAEQAANLAALDAGRRAWTK